MLPWPYRLWSIWNNSENKKARTSRKWTLMNIRIYIPIVERFVLFWKGHYGGVGDWTELQHIDLYSYSHNSVSFPLSCAAQPGAQPLWVLVFPTASYLQLVWSPTTDLLSSPWLYNHFTSTLLPASVTIALIQPVHGQGINTLIFLDRMHLLFTQVNFLFWQSGRVVDQYATQNSLVISSFDEC